MPAPEQKPKPRGFATAARSKRTRAEAAGSPAPRRTAQPRASAEHSAAVLARLALAGVGMVIVAGCSTATPPHTRPGLSADSTASGHASIGPLTISGGYIPQPASPDVATAYLAITNTGAVPDTITKITTSVAASVMAMSETDHNGVGTMTDLQAVTIPAHGRISFTPGRAHLMLQSPNARLRAGQRVTATITFAHAGTITFTLPVTPLTAPGPTSSTPVRSPNS